MGKKVTGACKENKVTEPVKRVYAFGKDAQGNNVTEGNTTMKATLGGKGANLAEMANIGLPVPPGFSITCQTCVAYSSAGNVWPDGVLDEIDVYRKDLEKRMGKKLGDKDDPLLVSVRSGAPFSMPGMMDTVLNLGLNDDSVQGLIKKTGNPRFGYDSYRRFVQMFSDVVMGVDGSAGNFGHVVAVLVLSEAVHVLLRHFTPLFEQPDTPCGAHSHRGARFRTPQRPILDRPIYWRCQNQAVTGRRKNTPANVTKWGPDVSLAP